MSSADHHDHTSGTGRGSRGASPLSRDEAARYIGAITAELGEIARRSDLDLLAYFLEMARMEAQELVKAERAAEAEARRRL
ncbi:hypothetical protein [Salinarimonas rosea]|uniref:hypothetical protein n=1 Tax=Salinarimonas rosea TaxID=552063 RepID=UPI00041F51CD|nr:hypothetical protein [Salinarimonas rosea]